MPDNSFYELLRSVFGKIKTPFNKQQLLNDLEAFLLREDIQKTIASYIDETDAKIISAAALFGEPSPGQLVDFFSDEFSSAQLHDIIVNLEERFILYRFPEEKAGISRLALNPVLKPVLQPFAADAGAPQSIPLAPQSIPLALFPEAKEKVSAAPPQKKCVNDLILAGLFSFACSCEAFFRPDGTVRKRIINEGKPVFPDIDIENITGALQVLGLFYADGVRLTADRKYIDDFALLSACGRSEYCAAALIVYNEQNLSLEILPPVYRSRIRELVNLIHSFLNMLKPESVYPGKTLKRMIELLKAQTDTEISYETLFKALEETGLIVKAHNSTAAADLKKLGAIAHAALAAQNRNTDPDGEASGENELKPPVIAIDSGSSIFVYPEINFSDAIKLASVLKICEASTVVRFKLDKDAAIRAFDGNISADEIINLLNKLSGGKTDDALIWNLRDWEKRHGEVSIKKGVILTLSQEHRYLTETNPLASLIAETPAPGLYLLDENAADEAVEALQKAGVDIIARRGLGEVSGKRSQKQNVMSANKYFPPPSSPPARQNNTSSIALKTDRGGLCGKKYDFYSILEKMQLSGQERAELSARIERRLIICESQLRNSGIRFEKLEAKRMDYSGKQNIAKQAIAQHSPVEIVITEKGKEKRIFGVPRALEKEADELILTVDDMRIPLAKISLLRRIKKSIFEKQPQ